MSFSNLYSGFKSLGESLLSPTKALFNTKEEPRRSPNYEKKGSISTAASPHAYSKTEYSPERDLWDDAESSLFAKPRGHKSRQEVYSTSTQASVNPWKKPGHSHRKSLINLIGEQGVDSIKLHDGKMEAVQSTEAPFLFARGGYESYVTTQNVKPTHMPKKSVSRKGGFLIMEKEGEAEEEEEVFNPLSSSTFIPKNNRQSFHGSQTCKAATSNESFSSYAKKADITPKVKSIPKISARDPQGNEINDPLTGSMSTVSSIGKQRNSFKRLHSAATPHLSETLLTDTLFVDVKASSAKDRQPLSPGMVDNSFQSTVERTASHMRNGTGSYLNITPSHSRMGSTIIFEDQTSEFGLDLEVEEDNSSSNSSREKISDTEETDSLRTQLIEEYKSLQKQQLYAKGIYIVPTSNPLVWSCLVFIKGGYYEKGKFKFQIHFPNDYPSEALRVYSLTKIYHSLINIETGEVDLKLYEQNGENKLGRLAEFIKSIFNESKYLEKLSSFNQEAGTKFTQNPNYFKIKAKESVRLSQKNSLNENTETAQNIPENIDSVRQTVKDIAKSQIKFEDKVQMLIQRVTKNVNKTQ